MTFVVITWVIVIIFGLATIGFFVSEDMWKSTATTTVICLLLLLSSCGIGVSGIPIPTGDGEHTGYVTATENSGLIWKAKRAYIKTDTQSSQEDAYCVIDESVFAALKRFAETKAHVRVYHTSQLVFSITKCNAEDAVIVSVAPVEAASQ